MRAHRIIALAASLSACAPSIPLDDKSEDPPPETDDTPPVDDTAESDLPPVDGCAVREVEPNNGPTVATALPTEVRGCGGFDTELDVDFWSFELAEDTWFEVVVDAFSIGSRADVQATLSVPGGDLVVAASSWMDRPDVRLLFPSQPARFELVVRQEDGTRGAGEDHVYEVFASTSKAPVDYGSTEQEPNDSREEGQALAVDGSVLGFVDDPGDVDVYVIDLPAGTQALTLDVEAHVHGSAGDFALELRDADGALLAEASGGLVGFDIDPTLVWTSEARQTVYVTVRSQRSVTDTGQPFWYVLQSQVEAEE